MDYRIRPFSSRCRRRAGLALAVLVAAGAATAAPVIDWLGPNYPSDLSADGTAAAGNTAGNYNAFRWTRDTGVVDLGMSTSEVLGGGAGTPDISADGNRVSATIITPDSLYATQGIWTKGIGWQVAMPPLPADGGALDNAYGSAWGLSGDGTTVTGLYWRPGQAATGLAHASTWNLDGTFTALPTPVRNCRANDASFDGSVVVGWSENSFGTWCPTVWENGTVTVLHDRDAYTEAEGVSDDGDVIWGAALDTLTNQVSAALWFRTETGWDEQILGVLPGTFPGSGQATCNDRAEYTGTIVGYNTFDGSPYNNTGFVWTLEEGMMSAADFFAARGVTLPPSYVVDSLAGISDNGNVITGFGHAVNVFPYQTEGFVITLDDAAPVPDDPRLRGVFLDPNFPNPFNPVTTLSLAVAEGQDLQLDVYDVRGRLVRRLHDGWLDVGRHTFTWDGRDAAGREAASGVYLARVTGRGGDQVARRMTLVK